MHCLGLAAVEAVGTQDIAPIALVPNGPSDLMGKLLKNDIDFAPEVIGQIVSVDLLIAKVTRKKEVLDILDQFDNRFPVGNGDGLDMMDILFIFTTFDNGINDSRKLTPEVLRRLKGDMALLFGHSDTRFLFFRHGTLRKI